MMRRPGQARDRTDVRSLTTQVKVNRDCGFDFYRLPIQKKWLVAPLLDRLIAAGTNSGCALTTCNC